MLRLPRIMLISQATEGTSTQLHPNTPQDPQALRTLLVSKIQQSLDLPNITLDGSKVLEVLTSHGPPQKWLLSPTSSQEEPQASVFHIKGKDYPSSA